MCKIKVQRLYPAEKVAIESFIKSHIFYPLRAPSGELRVIRRLTVMGPAELDLLELNNNFLTTIIAIVVIILYRTERA